MPLVIPYPSFTPGTTIFSAQVNNNNAAIATWANTHEVATTGVHGITGAFVGTTSSNTFTNTNYFSSNNFRIYSSVNPAFYLGFDVNSSFTANRTLFLNFGDSNRTLQLGGNISTVGDISTAGALSTAGAFSLTLTTTAATNVTLPTTGTLATLAGVETLTNKTLTNPTSNSGTFNSPTLASPTMTGTVAGDHAYSGQILLSSATAPTANYSTRWGDARLWARITSAGAISSSYNVASVSTGSTGHYLFTPTTNFQLPLDTNMVLFIFPYGFGFGGSDVWAYNDVGTNYGIADGIGGYNCPHNLVAFGVQ